MPFDFPPAIEPRLLERLARAGVLNDASLCSQWLLDRVDHAKRRQILNELFPICGATHA